MTQLITRFGFGIATLALASFAALPAARAEDAVTVNISIKDHRFQPAELQAPAGKPIVIVVKNLDSAPAEFESNMLRVEKVVTGGGTITLRIRPLDPDETRLINVFETTTALLIGERWARWHYVENRKFDDPQAVLNGLERGLMRLDRLVRVLSGSRASL